MLCDVVLAILITYSNGQTQVVSRGGATQVQVPAAQAQIDALRASPAFQAQMIKENIMTIELQVKKFHQFDCSHDPEAPL